MFVIRTRHPGRLTSIASLGGGATILIVGYLLGWSDQAFGGAVALFSAFIGGFRASLEHPDVPLDRWGRRLPGQGGLREPRA